MISIRSSVGTPTGSGEFPARCPIYVLTFPTELRARRRSLHLITNSRCSQQFRRWRLEAGRRRLHNTGIVEVGNTCIRPWYSGREFRASPSHSIIVGRLCAAYRARHDTSVVHRTSISQPHHADRSRLFVEITDFALCQIMRYYSSSAHILGQCTRRAYTTVARAYFRHSRRCSVASYHSSPRRTAVRT